MISLPNFDSPILKEGSISMTTFFNECSCRKCKLLVSGCAAGVCLYMAAAQYPEHCFEMQHHPAYCRAVLPEPSMPAQ
jgi:hypothetical protein